MVRAQWSGNQGVLGSNAGRATSELLAIPFINPTLPVSFEGDTKSCWSILSQYLVFMSGELKAPTPRRYIHVHSDYSRI